MKSVVLKLDKINYDGSTQPRVKLDEVAVEEYAHALTEGAALPPIVLFHDGADYWLADGFHRFHAHRKIGALDIEADVRQGTRRDAVLYSVGANASHGLRRTNDDKRKAVLTLLEDEEWAKWSDREIARACGVSHPFVANLRPASGNDYQIEQPRIVQRNGKTYEQNTANIGKKPVQAVPAPADPVPAEYADATAFDDTDADAITALEQERQRLVEDNEMMGKVFDADDKLAAAMAEVKRLTEENRVLRERVNGLMNEKNMAVKQAKMWRAKFEKLERVAA